MKVLIYFFIISFIFVNSDSMKEQYRTYSELNKWALDLGMKHNKIHYNFSTTNTYIADSNINTNEMIFEFPEKMFISINNTLDKVSKKLRKVWKKYSKNEMSPTEKLVNMTNELNYLCLVQQAAHLTKKGGFYEYYQYYLDDKKDNLEHFPSMYTEDELEVVQPTYFGGKAFQLKTRSIEICKEFDSDYKSFCNEDLFLQFRVDETNLRFLDGSVIIIPILDKIKIDPIHYNSIEEYDDKTKTYIIKAFKPIKAGDEIILKSLYSTNTENLIKFGLTFDSLKDKIKLKITAMSQDLAGMVGYTESDMTEFDITPENTIDNLYEYYLNISNVTVGRKDPYEAYNIMHTNLDNYYEGYPDGDSIIYEKVFNKENRVNIQRMIKAEIDILEKRVKEAKEKMDAAKVEHDKWEAEDRKLHPEKYAEKDKEDNEDSSTEDNSNEEDTKDEKKEDDIKDEKKEEKIGEEIKNDL